MKTHLWKFSLVFVLFTMVLSGCSTKQPASFYDSSIPYRKPFGYDLGKYLTLEGHRENHRPLTGVTTLRVEKLNGEPLEEPAYVWIRNVDKLPENDLCIFNGYFSGQMFGIPFEVSEKEGWEMGQAAWGFNIYFEITSIEQPAYYNSNPSWHDGLSFYTHPPELHNSDPFAGKSF